MITDQPTVVLADERNSSEWNRWPVSIPLAIPEVIRQPNPLKLTLWFTATTSTQNCKAVTWPQRVDLDIVRKTKHSDKARWIYLKWNLKEIWIFLSIFGSNRMFYEELTKVNATFIFRVKMKAALTSETFVSPHNKTWRQSSEDLDLKCIFLLSFRHLQRFKTQYCLT
jgi:hypothetical protein